MARLDFNASDVPEDNRSFEPIPPGNYLLQVIDSEVRDTRNGTGQFLKLTLQVLDGPYTNRLIWDNLNIRNQSPEAERIANRNLANLLLLLGMTFVKESEELHFKPFIGRVGIKEDKDGRYPPQNSVRYYLPKDNQPAAAAAPPRPPSPPSPPSPPRAAVAPQQQRTAPPQTPPQPGRNPMPAQAAAPPRNGGPKPWHQRPPAREVDPPF